MDDETLVRATVSEALYRLDRSRHALSPLGSDGTAQRMRLDAASGHLTEAVPNLSVSPIPPLPDYSAEEGAQVASRQWRKAAHRIAEATAFPAPTPLRQALRAALGQLVALDASLAFLLEMDGHARWECQQKAAMRVGHLLAAEERRRALAEAAVKARRERLLRARLQLLSQAEESVDNLLGRLSAICWNEPTAPDATDQDLVQAAMDRHLTVLRMRPRPVKWVDEEVATSSDSMWRAARGRLYARLQEGDERYARQGADGAAWLARERRARGWARGRALQIMTGGLDIEWPESDEWQAVQWACMEACAQQATFQAGNPATRPSSRIVAIDVWRPFVAMAEAGVDVYLITPNEALVIARAG